VKLLLARHGNTFEAGATPTIVGRWQNPALTAEGEAQAARLAQFCQSPTFKPDIIYCGSLLRTQRMAEIVAGLCTTPAPSIDDRLTEIDYGGWSGLTMADVRARFGDTEADAWEYEAIMPTHRGWSPTADAIQAGIDIFAREARGTGDGTVLAISSNGILRFFAHLVPGLFDRLKDERALKVATGHVCCLEWTGAAFDLVFWNQRPE
jgi:probable phosphoglycerate mutase